MKQAATLFLSIAIAVPSLCFIAFSPEKSTEKNVASFSQAQTLSDKQIPAESLYQLMAAEIALDRDSPEIALANYIAAAKETQDPQIAARATQIALTIGTLDAAIVPASIWAKSDPKNLEAQITTAAIYIRLNKVEKALPYLRLCEQLNQDETLQYFLLLSRQLSTAPENAQVIEALTLLAKEETRYISAHLALAEIYLSRNAFESALTLSTNALRIAPESVLAAQLHAQALLALQGKEAALHFLESAAQKHPQDLLLQSYFAQFLLENGYDAQAKKSLSALITQPEISTDLLIGFAKQCLQREWYTLAEKILERTSKIPEQKDLSYYWMARSAQMQNNEKGAIEWYKQVLTGPLHTLSQIRASHLLSERGDHTQALSLLTRTQPNDDEEKKQLLLATVEILNKTKQYKQAFTLLSDALDSLPDDFDLLYARSLMADKIDALTIAENDLRTILAAKPNHVDALNALGYLLSTKTQRFTEALVYLTKAQQLAPKNASVLDSLGWLYYKMGEHEKSIVLLKQAVAILPDAEISAHLNEVLWHAKDLAKTKKVSN